MPSSSSERNDSSSPVSKTPTTAPSSPPTFSMDGDDYAADFDPSFANDEEKAIYDEDLAARKRNEAEEKRIQKKAAMRRKKKSQDTPAERDQKAKQLDDLLTKSSAFGDILTKKTEVLGKVGSGFDGKALGEHDLVLATQPECMTGGTMRDYQLEGLTWMYEIGIQGISGILADEMGLGKTIQTISLLAKYRDDGYYGPFLIIAPLSTLSNWMDEFAKWCPTLPVTMYHGTPDSRKEIMKKVLLKNYNTRKESGNVNDKFPIVITTPEIIIRDANDLIKLKWETIIIDEGHRLKNADSKLFNILTTFTSVTRFLITGTPLQNSLKELWSLLHFLMPTIFRDWQQFESWFDFDDLQDEEGTESFLQDKQNQDLIKKIHLILQPLLLRRIKADVEHLLPKKREYILYAPLTKDQTDLYNAINDKAIDTRQFLEDKVIERLTEAADTPSVSRTATPHKQESSDSEEIPLSKLAIQKSRRGRPAKKGTSTPKNAFQQMMQKRAPSSSSASSPAPTNRKRKSTDSLSTPASKSAKSSRASTPATSVRGRKIAKRKTYTEGNSDEEDALSDDEFEAKLADEMAVANEAPVVESDPEEAERARIVESAKKEISNKKLGNPIMQLRLVCNSPHLFYNPWSSGLPLDESLVTSSGKMLLLDRLLPHLFSKNSKVLIFSQFKVQLDLLEDYARELRGWNVCRIDGSVAQEDRRQQIRQFNEDPEFKLFLLSTRAGGQGINLASADTVILFDSDWNPQQDLQAQDRAHRIGQKNPVVIYRLATKGTVEEELLLSADAKRRLEKLVIKKGGFKTMGQKVNDEGMSREALKALLLKDGEVFKYQGGEEVLSHKDLEILTDRSEDAYVRAEKGQGDSEGFKIVETKVGGLMMGMDRKRERGGGK